MILIAQRRPKRGALGSGLLVVLGCLMALSVTVPIYSAPDDQPVDVYFYSPSGEYELEVKPKYRGRAWMRCMPSRMTMRRDGLVIWSREYDHTLGIASVTDAGRVIGCMYHQDGMHYKSVDPEHRRPEMKSGIMVAVFDPLDGDTLSEIDHEGLFGVPCSFWFAPLIQGIHVDEANELAVLRTQPRGQFSATRWWVYDLTTGKEITEVFPVRGTIGEGNRAREVHAVRLEGYPLIAVHWKVHDVDSYRARAARVSIHDLAGTELWHDQFGGEYDGVDFKAVFRWDSREWDGSNSHLFENPLLQLRKQQLVATDRGFRFHSISLGKVIEYKFRIRDDGELHVEVAGVVEEPFEFEDGEL